MVLHGVELEIGVLDEDDVAGDVEESATYGGALTDVYFVGVDLDDLVGVGGFFSYDVDGGVAGAVVDDDDFLGDVDGENFFEELTDGGLLVIDRDDDGKLHNRLRPVRPPPARIRASFALLDYNLHIKDSR